ncbi:NAD(P)/FAD-dependent oxidoreductase [Fodinibacter luteus]|uniref:NAD(P)/FAD-dependent oxidoreductase n=1 Tax=Fodinibacter luteus TaxID=552064 RepID=A0ABP8KEC3_9MICO
MSSTHRADATERTWRADVVVVGARCAGAATAMLLADAGHDVLVLDRASFPSDTVSTHVIARTGMVQLSRWGLLDALHDSGAPRVRTVEIDTGADVVVRTVKERHGVDHLLAPRRVVLDGILQDAARRSGARVVTGVGVDDVIRDAVGRVEGVRAHDSRGGLRVLARHVVGADGLGSRVARAVGAPMTVERPTSGATLYAYHRGPWSSIEYHVGEHALAGVFPTHGGEGCVWVCTPEDVARRHQRSGSRDAVLADLLAEVTPGFADRVRGTERTSPVRGMLRMPNHVRRAWGPGWSLVGDAGYHRDAITGHGMSDAFRDAELLAAALDTALGDPAAEAAAMTAYAATRDRMARPILDLTCALAAFPGAARFVELQRRLAVVIDEQAAELAARPTPSGAAVA